jgi:SAM-dependent methyltransferase
MNNAVYGYVEALLVEHPDIHGDVLEVGSYDVNGSIRPLFTDHARFPYYLGVDMQAGPEVDRVMKADCLLLPSGSFNCVVCVEMLEHDNRFWLSMQEFHRVLLVGGHLVVTTRGIGYPKHDHPSDYWRFTAEGLRTVMEWAGFSIVSCEGEVEDRPCAVGTRALAVK